MNFPILLSIFFLNKVFRFDRIEILKTFTFSILSKVTPRSVKISEGDSVTFRPNDNLTLTCEVFDSKPAANISWVIKSKDGMKYVELFPCKH